MQQVQSAPMYEQYKRIKLLGEGAFGKAYLVQCHSDSSFCVIKQVDFNRMSSQEKQEAFKEAHILEVLSHPNIIKFKEVYTTKKGKLCIVMDYADGKQQKIFIKFIIGGDLACRIKNQSGTYFSENQILDWFTQITLALKHVHDRKIIHRDLKTQNIFLTKQNQIKLGDFGIARILRSTLDKAKTQVGTPYYLSPEIVENRPYSFKSDIWSLGVILYELCALHPPFNANCMVGLAMKISKGNFTPIPTMYSRDLKKLVDSLLLLDARRRPSAQDVLAMPFIQKRIKNFLNETITNYEFSHTILHQNNVLPKNKKIIQMREDEFGKPVQSNGNYLNVNNILQNYKQQQQIIPPQQIIAQPLQQIPNREDQILQKQQQQFQEKKNQQQKLSLDNKNENQPPLKILPSNSNNQPKYKKNIREGIFTPTNQKPLQQNFFPVQTPSNGNWQPQFQRNNSKNQSYFYLFQNQLFLEDEEQKNIKFPSIKDIKDEKKQLIPPSQSKERYQSNDNNKKDQEKRLQQLELCNKINEKNKKYEELKCNKHSSPETKWRIIREEKELDREIERNKMKIDISQKRKEKILEQDDKEGDNNKQESSRNNNKNSKKDIPVEIYMPKFKEQSKEHSVQSKSKEITPERQIIKQKSNNISPNYQSKENIKKYQSIDDNKPSEKQMQEIVPKESKRIIDQCIWKNNQEDQNNKGDDIQKMVKELEDILMNDEGQNIIKEEANEQNITLGSIQENELDNLQIQTQNNESSISLQEIKQIPLDLEKNLSNKKNQALIDQIKLVLSDVLGTDAFNQSYNYLQNQLKNENDKNKFILSYYDNSFFSSIPYLNKQEFSANYGLLFSLAFMEEQIV